MQDMVLFLLMVGLWKEMESFLLDVGIYTVASALSPALSS